MLRLRVATRSGAKIKKKKRGPRTIVLQLSVFMACLAKIAGFCSLVSYSMFMYTGTLGDLHNWADSYLDKNDSNADVNYTHFKEAVLENTRPLLLRLAFAVIVGLGVSGIATNIMSTSFLLCFQRFTTKFLIALILADAVWSILSFGFNVPCFLAWRQIQEIEVDQLKEANLADMSLGGKSALGVISGVTAALAVARQFHSDNETYQMANELQRTLRCCGFYHDTDWWKEITVPVPLHSMLNYGSVPKEFEVNFPKFLCQCMSNKRMEESRLNKSTIYIYDPNQRLCFVPSGCCSNLKVRTYHDSQGCMNISKGIDMKLLAKYNIDSVKDLCKPAKASRLEDFRRLLLKKNLIAYVQPETPGAVYKEPCFKEMINLVKSKMLHFLLLVVAMSCIHIFSLVCSCLIFFDTKRNENKEKKAKELASRSTSSQAYQQTWIKNSDQRI